MTSPEIQPVPWKNFRLPLSERVEDLISRLTLEEKITQLEDSSPAIERVGLPAAKYGGEALHGLCNTGRATIFPMPIGMAATFDPELIRRVATATSDEMRAKFHDPVWSHSRAVTLTVYSPVINILRDPRWGRAQETYGEDPCLTSAMGVAYVRGLQGDHPKYLKLAACAKHLGVHSGPESLRQKFDAQVSPKDMAETYLPAFGELVRAGAATVMATYNRVNGQHCCAHSVMIGEYLRAENGFEGVVLSDGGALGSLHTTHNITANAVETAGLCLKNGCDFELGHNAYHRAAEAIETGLITEAEIDRALRRVLTLRFRLGEFDPADENPYTRIPRSVIQSPEHLDLAQETATKSMVLLKNNGVLPFPNTMRTITVTGPNAADIQLLLGNFYRTVSPDLRTILEGIAGSAPEGTVITHMQGCFLTHPNVFPSDWHLGLTDWADAAVAVVGFTPLMEGENGECIGSPDGGDKAQIALPENQLQFLRELRARMDKNGKPLVVVVTGGCPLELEEVHGLADAVVMAWYPGERGGVAVGDILFGKENPSGKLPATFPRRLSDLPPYEDYALRGRTYRYMETPPMYPFGFGLSYSKFIGTDLKVSKETLGAGETVTVSLPVTNAGEWSGEEVAQLYVAWPDQPDAPRVALKAFQRVALKPGETREITFALSSKMLETIDEKGISRLVAGPAEIIVASQAPVPSLQPADVGWSARIGIMVG